MKRIKYLLGFSVVALISLSVSCTKDFEEINTNKNAPTTELAAPNMLLTNAIESMTDRVHDIWLGGEIGSCWVQHLAKVQYTDEDRYVPRVSVINSVWSSFYAASGNDVATIIELAKDRGHDNYLGVGYVLQAYIMSVVTDLWGDVPYSEAFKAKMGIVSPKYDTQESIYRTLIAKLDSANILLDPNGAEIEGDILYGNDISKWKKFANSLRLRLLLRMSKKDEAFVTQEMTKMVVTNAADYPIFESNNDNAALKYLGSSPNNNPINENRKTRDDHRVSKTIIDFMWTNNPYVDWRVMVYANLSEGGGDYVGLPNGLTSAKAAAYLGNGLKMTSKLGDYFTKADAPGMLMSYAELLFILSEATQKGYITGGSVSAQQYYEDGIAASYEQFGNEIVSLGNEIFGNPANMTIQDYISNYLTSGDGAWDYNGDGNPLPEIYYQKWLAMFDQGLQAWFEWRRTGYPVLTPAEDGLNDGKIPIRLYYPSDESARNNENLKEAVQRQGTDDLNTPVWWATN
ncbi:MAG: hypothetical protein PWR03_620 [Tenuifilum sp.]|jgi:hypothetical protein|uniref:SusD/RagB family nutrient-binding outer membrane lipoprotein n=1 Tax=Tenuifilum sp. TaxID=2760880 RepID=UPI0024AC7565|nr:SusD/RagB family nutrient-binding outer membrane lipoprotein [Tenuifilum sp.]MDI3526437.1 hypothetical protein [Tenuifilum sp.]